MGCQGRTEIKIKESGGMKAISTSKQGTRLMADFDGGHESEAVFHILWDTGFHILSPLIVTNKKQYVILLLQTSASGLRIIS